MKNFQNISKYPLVMIFLICIALPSLNGIFGFWEFERVDENRVFQDTIHLNIQNLDAFPEDCEAYINDNFSFRAPLLDLYHSFKYYCLKTAPHPDKTIIGKDGWFFNAGKEREAFEGKWAFEDADLARFESEWSARREYLDSLGIKYYWLISPTKHHVYSDKLPFYIQKNRESRTAQLRAYFEPHFPDFIIDPTEKLVESKEFGTPYYRMDNHWSHYGASVAATALLDRVQLDFPDSVIANIPEYSWTDSVLTTGIHYKSLGIKSEVEIGKFPILDSQKAVEASKYGFPPTEGFAYPHSYEMRFVNSDSPTELRMLFIRDSFGEQMMPFVMDSFEESVFIFDAWRYQLNREIVERVKPDIIVFQNLETHLEGIINSK